MGRISYHHDDKDEERKEESIKRKVESELTHSSISSGDRDPEASGRSIRTNSRKLRPRSASQTEPTRRQPSRKVKKVCKERSNSSANCKSNQTLQNGDSRESRQLQPQRKVKSAQANFSGDHGAVSMAMNHHPVASSSGTPVDGCSSGSGAASASRNGDTFSRNSGASASRNIQTSGANNGPSRKWTRKKNVRQQQAAGTSSSSYEQYNVEDFLKAIPPSSFYAKKGPPQ